MTGMLFNNRYQPNDTLFSSLAKKRRHFVTKRRLKMYLPVIISLLSALLSGSLVTCSTPTEAYSLFLDHQKPLNRETSVSCVKPELSDVTIAQYFKELGQLAQDKNKTCLKTVTICGTSVRRIDSESGSQLAFRKIKVTNNKELEHINPYAFRGSFRYAREVYFSDNSLHSETYFDGTTIFETVAKFRKLNQLNLKGNKLTGIPRRAFYEVGESTMFVKNLNLSHNRIEHIDDMALFDLNVGRSLDLSFNKISSLTDKTFSFDQEKTCSKPLFINLRDNQLSSEYIHPQAFATIGRRLLLDLQNNQLKEVDRSTFEPIIKENQTCLKLKGNPLTCGCDSQWLLAYKSNVLDLDQLICPNGKKLSDIKFKGCPPIAN